MSERILPHESSHVNSERIPTVHPDHLSNPLRDTYKAIQYKEYKTGLCYADMEWLAGILGVSVSQAYRRVNELKALGMVEIVKKKGYRRLLKTTFRDDNAKEMRTPCEKNAKNEGRARKRVSKPETLKSNYVKPKENSEEDKHHIIQNDNVVTDAEEANSRGVRTPVGTETAAEGDSRLEREGAFGAEVCAPCCPTLFNGSVAPEINRRQRAQKGSSIIEDSIPHPPSGGNSRETTNSIPHPPAATEATQANTLIEKERDNTHDGRTAVSAKNESGRLGTPRTQHGETAPGFGTDGRRYGEPVQRTANAETRAIGHTGRMHGTYDTLIEIGVSPGEAARLVAQFDGDRIKRVLAYLRQQQARGYRIDNPAGFVRSAIVGMWNIKLLDMSPETIQKRAEKLRYKAVGDAHSAVMPDWDKQRMEAASLRERVNLLRGGVGV